MRIAVLSRNFATTGGGAERYSIAIVEQLAARHEVHVFAQRIAHEFPGVHYHRIAFRIRRPRWINQIGFALATWWLTRRGFDIVHSHENIWHGNVQTVHVLPVTHSLFNGRSGWARVRQVLSVATSPRLLSYLWMERQRYRISGQRQIVVTSNALLEAMKQSFPASAGALNVITPGVVQPVEPTDDSAKLEARRALGLPEQGYGLLFVGNDVRKKGLPTLIQAMTELPSDMFLAVVGSPRNGAVIADLVTRAGVSRRVHFVGGLSDISTAYRAADVLVHPTLQDAYGMVVLEAMAFGIPVVASGLPFCGIAADLKHQETALLLDDPRSASAVAQAVLQLREDAALSQRLVQAGRAFASQHSWAQAGLQHEALFRRVIG
jgi:UDP-glucose:(heptosyl)LPS alpha-1,3-glucosyltransferase